MAIKLVTVTGPSCAGKTTLVRKLLENDRFCEVISFTTRPKRAGEIDGKDYYFMDYRKAEELIIKGKTAEYTKFKSNIYGIEKREIDAKLAIGKIPLSIVEPTGLKQLRTLYTDEIFSVYVDASVTLLYQRFLERLAADIRSGADVSIPYYALRLAGIAREAQSWKEETNSWDFFISDFTSDNEESIISSLTKVLINPKRELRLA